MKASLSLPFGPRLIVLSLPIVSVGNLSIRCLQALLLACVRLMSLLYKGG